MLNKVVNLASSLQYLCRTESFDDSPFKIQNKHMLTQINEDDLFFYEPNSYDVKQMQYQNELAQILKTATTVDGILFDNTAMPCHLFLGA